MKKQNKLNIKIRDMEPLKDVTAGRRGRHGRAEAFREQRLVGDLVPFGDNRFPQ
jgi:hypothetical protein